jgi:hypothetical protein
MSPYGNRDGASSRASSIKTAWTSRLWVAWVDVRDGCRQEVGAGEE